MGKPRTIRCGGWTGTTRLPSTPRGSQRDGFTPCDTNTDGTIYTNAGSDPSAGCNWAAKSYRLPMEAKREKAVRGQTTSVLKTTVMTPVRWDRMPRTVTGPTPWRETRGSGAGSDYSCMPTIPVLQRPICVDPPPAKRAARNVVPDTRAMCSTSAPVFVARGGHHFPYWIGMEPGCTSAGARATAEPRPGRLGNRSSRHRGTGLNPAACRSGLSMRKIANTSIRRPPAGASAYPAWETHAAVPTPTLTAPCKTS